MIDWIEIQHFRGIRHVRLEGLTPLVVLVGPNGCGKTTVMECLHIACQPVIGVKMAVEGGLRRTGSFQWLTNGGQGEKRPEINTARHRIQLRISPPFQKLSLKVQHEDGQSSFFLERSEGQTVVSEAAVHTPLEGLPAVKTLGPFEPRPLEERFSDAARLGAREELRSLVRELLAPATDIEILIDKERPSLHVVYPTHAVPIDLVGEGVRTAVELLCSLAAPEGSLLLLEEPERHQHPRSLVLSCKAIWKTIQAGCQVVISTHNLEVLDYLLATAGGHCQQLTTYRLRLRNGISEVTRFDCDDLQHCRTLLEEDLR